MLGLLLLVTVLLWPRPLAAASVPVRFVEGAMHGFLVLRTVNGALMAPGDLLQVGRGGEVKSRMVFRFKDGSVFDETVVFTQQRVFTMQSYRLVQRGPAFTEDTEISLRNAFGQTIVAPYSVRRRPSAPVSIPLDWDEVDPKLDPARCNIRTIAERLAGVDPWADFWKHRQRLPDRSA